jgi:hypothetical protein
MPLDNRTVDQFRPLLPIRQFPAALENVTQNEAI